MASLLNVIVFCLLSLAASREIYVCETAGSEAEAFKLTSQCQGIARFIEEIFYVEESNEWGTPPSEQEGHGENDAVNATEIDEIKKNLKSW